MSNEFVHLHVHSEYSLLDGIIRLKELARRAVEYEMPAVALTDHGAMYGAIEFVDECREVGVKPIIGCEMYITESIEKKDDTSPRGNNHLVLLCKNETGYKNLLELVTRAYRDGFHYKPRIDKNLLEKYHDGLIAMTACLKGEIPTKLLMGKNDEAVRTAGWYLDLFGKDNFYIELQDHGISEEKRVLPLLAKLAAKMGIQVVATNDAHYLDSEDARYQDVMLCIQTGKKLGDENRMRFEGVDLYFKKANEMARLFTDHPEAITNTLAIAEMVDFQPRFDVYDFPKFPLPEGSGEDDYLADLARKGLSKRFSGKQPPSEYSERLDYELSVISEMGFSAVFLIVQDGVNYAKENGIPVGPGRGSAVSGIVSWALRITEVDPVKYDLQFERFLNPERRSLPDIDIDFCPRRRGEVMHYIKERYGAEHICQIITFNRMKARAAVRDTARVLDIPLSDADRIAKMVPFNTDLREALDSSPDLGREYDESPVLREWMEYAIALEGLARNVSVHPAGLVISGSPVHELVPVQTMESTEHMVSQYSMDYIDKLGLIKVDILGLRTLTYIEDTRVLVRERHGTQIDLAEIPFEDKKTYDLLGQGDTLGVFQMEGSGMMELLVELRPDCIDDVIACIALYRPGPMGSGLHTSYARRKNKLEEITFDHELLKPALKSTYGVFTFQEQVGRVLQSMGGFSLGRAVIVIKAISKKKEDEVNLHRQDFLKGAVDRDVTRSLAEKIFAQIRDFSGYGFNKAHAAAYGILAYQTAYLKANYPVEFYAAYLSSEMSDGDKISLIVTELRSHGINLLPPDVNRSGLYFGIEGEDIRFALGAIKNVGAGAIEMIVKARADGGEFKSLFDFAGRVDVTAANKQVLESLAYAGALDSIDGTRGDKIASIESAMEYGKSKQDDARKGQTGLFTMETAGIDAEPELVRESTEIPKKQLLKKEKEMIGLYLSENPLKEVAKRIQALAKNRISEIDETRENKKVVIGGMLTSVSRRISKKLQSYAIIEIEDLTGKIEGIVFPNTYEECKDFLVEDSIVIVDGRIQVEEKDVIGPDGEMATKYTLRVMVRNLEPLDEDGVVPTEQTSTEEASALAGALEVVEGHKKDISPVQYQPRRGEVILDIDLDDAGADGLDEILTFLTDLSGNAHVRLSLKHRGAEASIDLGRELMVDPSDERFNGLGDLSGVKGIHVG